MLHYYKINIYLKNFVFLFTTTTASYHFLPLLLSEVHYNIINIIIITTQSTLDAHQRHILLLIKIYEERGLCWSCCEDNPNFTRHPRLHQLDNTGAGDLNYCCHDPADVGGPSSIKCDKVSCHLTSRWN